MDDARRRRRGLKVRREVLGAAHVARATAEATALDREFQDLVTRYVWGEIWTRPGLDLRSRRILVMGTMIAIGRWEEFRMHAVAALREGGFTTDDLKEIVLQQAIYCGVPVAHHALKLIGELETAGR